MEPADYGAVVKGLGLGAGNRPYFAPSPDHRTRKYPRTASFGHRNLKNRSQIKLETNGLQVVGCRRIPAQLIFLG